MTFQTKSNIYENPSGNAELDSWVTSMAKQFNAKNIHWCDGSQDEYDSICELLVKKGTFIRVPSGECSLLTFSARAQR